jgi:hypothetical protein
VLKKRLLKTHVAFFMKVTVCIFLKVRLFFKNILIISIKKNINSKPKYFMP